MILYNWRDCLEIGNSIMVQCLRAKGAVVHYQSMSNKEVLCLRQQDVHETRVSLLKTTNGAWRTAQQAGLIYPSLLLQHPAQTRSHYHALIYLHNT